LLVWITGFWGLWTLAIGFVETLPQLYVVRILSSLGMGVFIPAAFSLIGDLFTDKARGRISGIMNAISLMGAMAAFSILPLLAASSPEAWRIGFIGMGLASFVTGLLIWLLLYEPPRGAAEPELANVVDRQAALPQQVAWADIIALLRIRSWRWLLVKEMLEATSLALLAGWSFTWLDSLGLGEAAIIVVLLMMLSIVAGAIFFG
jgi:MFS family permease